MDFVRTPLRDVITIRKLISFHYFEFTKGTVFEGESHDFWEFLYVDKGEVEVRADSAYLTLKQGDIIFHKPNEFHAVWANNRCASNLIVISFECRSKAMKFFENKLMSLGDKEINLLSGLMKEGFSLFLPPLDMPYVNALTKNPRRPFGAEQFFKMNLQALLIQLIRKSIQPERNDKRTLIARERSDDDLICRIANYLEQNIASPLSAETVCKHFNIGKTKLKTLFREKTGMSMLEYFNHLKVERAKLLIREANNNLTEIAEILGYSSVHYFSRHFKKVTSIPPSEYAKSVEAKTAKPDL